MSKNTTQQNDTGKIPLKRLVIYIFSIIWSYRLNGKNWYPYQKIPKHGNAKVVKVKGFRTALIDTPNGQRVTATFMFNFFGKYL